MVHLLAVRVDARDGWFIGFLVEKFAVKDLDE